MIGDTEIRLGLLSSPTVTMKPAIFPKRRGSNASENDFFDIPDESIASTLKHQLRRRRIWIILVLLFLLFKWLRRDGPPPSSLPHIRYDKVDWSRYAYTQYATSETYLCNSVMVFEALQRLGSRADRVLFYPDNWDLLMDGEYARISQLLITAKEKYKVLLLPVKINGIKQDPGALRVLHVRRPCLC